MAFGSDSQLLLSIHLVLLVGFSICYQQRDNTVWSAQVGSYLWYVHLYCHMLGSSPELAPQRNPTPILAPQPWHPIHLFRLSVVSSLCRAMRPHDQAIEVTKLVAPSTMMPRPRLKRSCCLPIPQCSTLRMSHPLWGPPMSPSHHMEECCPFLQVFLTLNSSIKLALDPHHRIGPTQISC